MLHLLGFILFLAMAVILAVVAIVMKILGMVRSMGRKAKDTFTGSSSESWSSSSSQVQRRKIFGEDEGEYVDYEEIPGE